MQTSTQSNKLKQAGLTSFAIHHVSESLCVLAVTFAIVHNIRWGAGGGAEEASRTMVIYAWAKFKELAPIFTSRGASLVVKGKVYKACVQGFWCMAVKPG